MLNGRSGWGRLGVGATVAAALLLGVAAGAGQQRPTGTQGSTATDSNYGVDPAAGSDPYRARLQEKQIASAATERHTRMVADADKLLQLATELKEDVDKSTKNEMSVTTVRKAAEIEKLAHEVKERMKGE